MTRSSAQSRQSIDFSYDLQPYRAGALAKVCMMQTLYYARVWQFGRVFECKVAGEMAEFLSRFDEKRDFFTLAVARGKAQEAESELERESGA